MDSIGDRRPNLSCGADCTNVGVNENAFCHGVFRCLHSFLLKQIHRGQAIQLRRLIPVPIVELGVPDVGVHETV